MKIDLTNAVRYAHVLQFLRGDFELASTKDRILTQLSKLKVIIIEAVAT